MRKQHLRLPALLLAVLMLLPSFAACSETPNASETEQSAVVTADSMQAEEIAEETEITRENTPDTLPADLDYNGETFTIYHSDKRNWTALIKGGEELTGEVVADTVIESNLAVRERLNVDLQYYPEPTGDWDTIATLVGNLIMANDDSFDVYMGEQYGMAQTATKGYYRNVLELPYLDFEQPWWNTTFMENLQISKDNRVFMTGDFSLTTLFQLFVQYFNKNLYNDLFGNPDDLYSLVLEGKWTLDVMSEKIEAAYIDLNGDGQADPEDQLGYVAYQTYSTVDPFMYCGDIPYTSFGDDGRIVINMNQERAVTLTEKVVNLFNQKGSYTVNTSPFVVGKSLFCNGVLGNASGFRDMADDFGFLPSPKLDETQEAYRNLVGDCVLLTAIPVTCTDAEMAAAVLEALNAQTYRTVTPAWYEVNLKMKYSRDMISADIIDLIHDSIYTSFLFAYSPVLNQMGQVMRDLVTNNNTDYMSLVKSKEKASQKMLERMYKDIAESQNP